MEAKTPAAAATVWIDTDGQFRVKNHDYFETAEEQAEVLNESGLPVTVIYREDFIEKVVGDF